MHALLRWQICTPVRFTGRFQETGRSTKWRWTNPVFYRNSGCLFSGRSIGIVSARFYIIRDDTFQFWTSFWLAGVIYYGFILVLETLCIWLQLIDDVNNFPNTTSLTEGSPSNVSGYLDKDSSVVMNFSPPQFILTRVALWVSSRTTGGLIGCSEPFLPRSTWNSSDVLILSS